jgi:hypothetical protein
MSIGTLYWLLLVLWVLFGAVTYWPVAPGAAPRRWGVWGGNLLLLVLFVLIGLKVMGPFLKD